MIRNAADRMRSRSSRFVVPACSLATLFILACGDSTEPPRATALAVATQPPGTVQSGLAFTQAPVVEIRDQNGARFAQAGTTVTVSIASGGGTLGGTTTRTTDAEGRATFSDLVITGTVGPRTLSFSAEGLTAATSSSITLAAGPAATLEAASSTTVQGTVNTAVTTLPSVVVKDASGNPVSGVAVTFAVASGGGALSGATPSTNASGTATLGGWTLPTTSGQYTLTATAAGVSGTGVTFTATANADMPTAMQPSNDGQSALYAARLPTPLQVRVVDQYGNPTPGVVVTWGSVTGFGSVQPINVATDANGIVRSNYQLSLTPGENVVRASISSRGLSVDFTATARGFSSQISVAHPHGCAIDDVGIAHCWGANDRGQVGDGAPVRQTTITPVGGTLRFRRITTGEGMTCALTTDDVPYCWGWGAYGSLGTGSTANVSVPTAVAGNHRFKEIATGGDVTCALTAGGDAYCWGSNGGGQLGIGQGAQLETCSFTLPNAGGPLTFPCSDEPVAVAGGLKFESITTGGLHVCGLTTPARELYCWGFGRAFGNDQHGYTAWTPERVASTFTFSQATAGRAHTCGIASNASYCWGDGTYGVLGNGSTEFQTTPSPVSHPVTPVRIEARGAGTCQTVTDGRIFCWGYNATGAVGDGTTTSPKTVPSTVASGQLFTAVSTSSMHACGRVGNGALTGQLHCWGNNEWGQLGRLPGPNELTPVLARP